MCSAAGHVRDGVSPWARGTEHAGLPLEMALNWGEDVAVRIGGVGTSTLTGRKSKWRGGEPTVAQMKFAHNLRIPGVKKIDRDHYETTLSKGELSEAIDAIGAARRIDPLVKQVTGS